MRYLPALIGVRERILVKSRPRISLHIYELNRNSTKEVAILFLTQNLIVFNWKTIEDRNSKTLSTKSKNNALLTFCSV